MRNLYVRAARVPYAVHSHFDQHFCVPHRGTNRQASKMSKIINRSQSCVCVYEIFSIHSFCELVFLFSYTFAIYTKYTIHAHRTH